MIQAVQLRERRSRQMPTRILIVAHALLVLASPFLAEEPLLAEDSSGRYWPQWRGPLGTGVAPQADPPIEWDETRNIRWKVALPGKGHSTPIVWGDRVFVTTAVALGDKLEPKYSGRPGEHDNLPVTQHHEFVVLALDRRDGSILWQKPVRKAHHRPRRFDTSGPP